MSVFVKGWTIPKGCADCPTWCKLYLHNREFRHPDCPLIEVPTPHGDLADKDKLMKEFMDSDLDHLQRDDWKEVIQIVSDAPTIIEAEE